MGFFKAVMASHDPAPYKVPVDWMPAAKMKRVVVHWTGGSYIASSLDKEHYHFVVEGDLDVLLGLHPVTANEVIGSKSQDDYAAHTKGTNTGAIGVSMCGSAGAVERPFSAGKFPITEAQWQRTAEAVASLCQRYGIAVNDKTVLTHAEVQTNLGIKQNGKWDIAHLTFGTNLHTAKACGDDFRLRVSQVLARL